MQASRSLRLRLTWYVVATLLTLTSLSGIAIYMGTTKEADEIFSASLVQTARIIDGLVTPDHPRTIMSENYFLPYSTRMENSCCTHVRHPTYPKRELRAVFPNSDTSARNGSPSHSNPARMIC